MVSITLKRGDTYIRTIKLYSEDELIDCTGWTIYFTIRETIPPTSTSDDTGAVISKTITGESTGIHTLTLTSDETAIDAKKYIFEFQIKKADGSIHSTESGIFIIQSDITRSS